MHIPKKYLRDKLVLLLVSVNLFLAMLSILVVFLLGGLGQNSRSYIVEYRANLSAVSPYKPGSIYPLLNFATFALMILIVNFLLSVRTYNLRRSLSLIILSLSALLLLLAVIVSYALLRVY